MKPFIELIKKKTISILAKDTAIHFYSIKQEENKKKTWISIQTDIQQNNERIQT